MKVKLVIVSPEVRPNEYEVTLPTKIGRGHEAKLKLVHPLVSRLHCELFCQGDQVFIRDLDSLNGTFVNQQRIDEDTPLPARATVMMGTVMFHLVYGPDADRLPPAAKKLDRTVAADGTVRNETLERISKSAAPSSGEERGDETIDEPTSVVSEEELESLAYLDENPIEEAPPRQSPAQAHKPGAKEAAKKPNPPVPPSGARPVGNPAPAKPAGRADDEEDEPFTVSPIDEPAEEESPKGEDDDMDNFFKSIM